MSDISEKIDTVARGPKSTTVDGQTVTQHSVKDLIDADQHVSEKAGFSKKKLPIRVGSFRMGGTV